MELDDEELGCRSGCAGGWVVSVVGAACSMRVGGGS